jgi:hypothetical protein
LDIRKFLMKKIKELYGSMSPLMVAVAAAVALPLFAAVALCVAAVAIVAWPVGPVVAYYERKNRAAKTAMEVVK